MELGSTDQKNSPILWVIGNSVMMDGIAACLEERQIINFIQIDTLNSDRGSNLGTSRPDLIIIEVENPILPKLLSLLEEHTNIHLLCLDLNRNKVIVMNCFQQMTQTMDDLYTVIEQVAASTGLSLKGGQLSNYPIN